MVVTKQVSSQLEWLSTLSTTFDAMDENEKFLRKVSWACEGKEEMDED